MQDISRFLDEEGRLKVWPAKRAPRMAALSYLAGAFAPGNTYSEREVNEILAARNAFSDHVLLRRALIDHGFLQRERDGSRYWRAPKEDV